MHERPVLRINRINANAESLGVSDLAVSLALPAGVASGTCLTGGQQTSEPDGNQQSMLCHLDLQ